jgi:hypothetical protein
MLSAASDGDDAAFATAATQIEAAAEAGHPGVGENGLRKRLATSSQVVGFGPRAASDLRREFATVI